MMKELILLMLVLVISCDIFSPSGNSIKDIPDPKLTITWEKISDNVGFQAYRNNSVAVHNNEVFIVVGDITVPDPYGFVPPVNHIYSSEDGETWKKLTKSSVSNVVNPALVVYRDSLWILSGYHPKLTSTTRVSADGINWIVVNTPAYLQERRYHTAIAFGDTLFVHGGIGYYASDFRMTAYSLDGRTWYSESNYPYNRDVLHHTSYVYDNAIWLLCGTKRFTICDYAMRSTTGIGFSNAAYYENSPDSVHCHASAILNDVVLLIGGEKKNDVITNETMFSLNSRNWYKAKTVNPFPARKNHVAYSLNGYVYVMGGAGYSDLWRGSIK